MCFVGMCPPITIDVFTMGFTMHNVTTSNTGGRKVSCNASLAGVIAHRCAAAVATAAMRHTAHAHTSITIPFGPPLSSREPFYMLAFFVTPTLHHRFLTLNYRYLDVILPLQELVEMLEFCARHKIGASIVERPMKGACNVMLTAT